MKIAVLGTGKMATLLKKLIEKEGSTLALPEECDVMIHFSRAEKVLSDLDSALKLDKPFVIGTTGWDREIEEAKKRVLEQGGVALYSPNFSIGVALFVELLNSAKKLTRFYDAGGIEIHHKGKKDAPSGTAKMISKIFENKFSFASVRVGEAFGKHELIFDSPYDTITLSHEAKSREGFVKGAYLAGKWIVGKKGWYSFEDVARDLYSTDNPV